MINQGPQVLTNDVNCAILDNDFLLSGLLNQYNKSTPEGKAKASLDFFEYIDCLKTDIQKNACLEQFCQTFDIDLEAARKDYTNRDQVSERVKRNDNEVQIKEAKLPDYKPTAELRAVLTAVSNDQTLFQKMRNEISVDDLEDSQAKKLFILLEECSRNNNFSISSILPRCENESLKQLIIESSNEYSNYKESSLNDSIKLIKKNVLERKRISIVNQIKRLERSGLQEEQLKITELLTQKMDIDKQISDLKG